MQSKKQRTIADKIIECLENEGVEFICGVPGEENSEFLMALDRYMHSGGSKMKFILTRHEQGAAFMCDTMARLTGKPQVVLTTLGPGATNAVTGVANAFLDSIPMVILTGQVDSKRIHRNSFQNIDTLNLFKPITHFSEAIRNAEATPEIIAKAFKLSRVMMGPTHVELSADVAKMIIENSEWNELKPIPTRSYVRPYPNVNMVREAMDLLSRSRRPLILAGVNVITNDAVDILRTFVQMTGIMVISTPRSKGIVDMRCPQSMFTAGFMVTDPHLLEALNNSDCIVTIGYDQRELPPERWNKRGSRDAPIIINIDCCTAEVEANFIPTVEVIGDIKQALTMMTQMLSEKTMEFKVPEFVQLRQMVKEHMEQQQLSNDTATGKLKPQKILNDIRQILDEDAILVSDVGQHMLYITRYYQCYHPRTCLIAGGFASMGFGLPGAIGAKLIYPNRQVVTICGDGGLLMSVQEMETAVRLKLNIVLLVWVDNEYGMISFEQEKEYHRTVFTKFGNPSFVELAKGFQWNSFYCDKSTEFSSIFKQALQMDGPSLIEIPIDYASQNKQLSSES